jgi:hypothetical protein
MDCTRLETQTMLFRLEEKKAARQIFTNPDMSEEIRVLILDIFVVNRGNTDDIQKMEVNVIQMALHFEIEVVDEHSAEYDIIHDYARRLSGKVKISGAGTGG